MLLLAEYHVYILTNLYRTVFYTGVTNDLAKRCNDHHKKLIKGFTQKYNVDHLVFYEWFGEINEAIAREKQIKAYSRSKKIRLIENFNSSWENLYHDGFIKKPANNVPTHPGDPSSRQPIK
jgi:putative endonuclease